jgi:1-deoxy-D-xylulose-5-phosphate reductoisomerase
MKKISILGSTGSIGTQTLDVIRQNPKKYQVIALAANKSIELLKKQIDEFKPKVVAVSDKKKADELEKQIDIPIYKGKDSLIKVASLKEHDLLVNSLVNSTGIAPTMAAIKEKKDIALANKESLVVAGKPIMDAVRKSGIQMTPIDSEHMGLFQCLEGRKTEDIRNLTITASGGPFRNYTRKEQFQNITLEQALNHPTWKMGSKISIDSATLMNKGNEVLEAMHLFNIPIEKINAVIHQQSIIHALVEFNDGNIIANMSLNDMRYPIQYALSYPERIKSSMPSLNLAQLNQLSFKSIKEDFFPCFSLAYQAGKSGGTMPCVIEKEKKCTLL